MSDTAQRLDQKESANSIIEDGFLLITNSIGKMFKLPVGVLDDHIVKKLTSTDFKGAATPDTDPEDNTGYYFATEEGTYENFNDIEVSADMLTILTRATAEDDWTKLEIEIPITDVTNTLSGLDTSKAVSGKAVFDFIKGGTPTNLATGLNDNLSLSNNNSTLSSIYNATKTNIVLTNKGCYYKFRGYLAVNAGPTAQVNTSSLIMRFSDNSFQTLLPQVLLGSEKGLTEFVFYVPSNAAYLSVSTAMDKKDQLFLGLSSYDEYLRLQNTDSNLDYTRERNSLSGLLPIVDDHIGDWKIRTDRTTVSTNNGDGYKVDVTGENGGLMLNYLINDNLIGLVIDFSFDVKVTDSCKLNIYFLDNTLQYDETHTNTEWQRVNVVGRLRGNGLTDYRILLCAPSSQIGKSFYIRNVAIKLRGNVKPNPYLLDVPSVSNIHNLLKTSNKLANLKRDSESDLLTIGILGDSWVQSVSGAINFVEKLTLMLRAAFGFGGTGYYDFSSGNGLFKSAVLTDVTDSRSGTITYVDQAANALGVSIAHAVMGNNAVFNLTLNVSNEKMVLHIYGGSEYGSFRYRIGSGDWTTIDTSELTGFETIEVDEAIPAGETVRFERVSGNVILLGVDFQNSKGVRVHKLGNRGLRTAQAVAVNESNWVSQMESLNCDTALILTGTNDRTDGIAPLAYKNSLNSWVNRILSANEETEGVLISPSNNKTVSANYTMVMYSRYMYSLAKERNLAHVNLMPLFGSTEDIIRVGSFEDDYHPTLAQGDRIAEFIFNKLFN